MSEMLRGLWLPIGGWDDVVAWLVDSLDSLDVGDVLDVGPSGTYVYENEDGDEIVPCAQAQALEDGVVWVRLSTTVMSVPLLSDLSSEGLELDVWQDGSNFDDCTDGYLVSSDLTVLAEAFVTWFRDRQGLHYDELGCEHHRAHAL